MIQLLAALGGTLVACLIILGAAVVILALTKGSDKPPGA